MYMADFDLRQLEMQLHGFDAALAGVGELGAHGVFNRDFTDFVHRKTGIDPLSRTSPQTHSALGCRASCGVDAPLVVDTPSFDLCSRILH
jgi:hypothetical protein